jgi:flap endonuclease-1
VGVNLRDIVVQDLIGYDMLKGRTVAVDALNTIYQFLASIRQSDGTPLMNSRGQVTSHLSGVLYRNTNLLRMGVKPVYVFDGKPPDLKLRTLKARGDAKREAVRQWELAKSEGREVDARKYAKRTSRLTDEMIADCKSLLGFMGIPYFSAPSEGEAQCAHMAARGDVWAAASQDYDSLLFGSPRLVRGVTLSGKMDLALVDLQKTLDDLGITREQLVDVAILVGTDFNEGVRGIGPKKALKAVKESRLGDLDFDLDAVRDVFLEHEVSDDYDIVWGCVDEEGLRGLLMDRNDFSGERVEKAVNELRNAYRLNSQQSLSKWF